jgi:hypothetical protein
MLTMRPPVNVGVENEVVVLRRHLGQLLRRRDARVVDQDVDRAHLGLGVGDGGLDAGVVGDVEPDDVGIAAVGFDLGAQRLQALDPAAGQRDAGAGLRERPRELRAEAAGGAGDERDAAGKIDVVAHPHAPSLALER